MDMEELKAENESLKKALKNAEDALYFYANKFNYRSDSMTDSENGVISQIKNDNGRIARSTMKEIEKSGFSKYGLLIHYKDGKEKILKYEDDDERDEDMRRLEMNKDVDLVCLYPVK